MTAKEKEKNSRRFLVTVVGYDHWNPEFRGWIEKPAGTTADQVLAEYRKKYPAPWQVIVMPEQEKKSSTG